METIDFNLIVSGFVNLLQNKPEDARATSVAINAYIGQTKDPHSRIVATKPFREEQEKEASFSGIGTELYFKVGKVAIKDFLPKSPAEASDLHAGDIIAKVDGNSVVGKSMDDIVKLIRGTVDTKVKLGVIRDEQELEIEITRARVTSINVQDKLLDSNLGYIKVKAFHDNTCQDFFNSIKKLEKQNMKGLLIDLRGNPGGQVTQAVCMGAIFLGTDAVILKQKGVGQFEGQDLDWTYEFVLENKALNVDVPKQGIGQNYPVMFLIDSGSGSASELLSGALQDANAKLDNKRYWVAGDLSYGKGTMQGLFQFSFNGYQIPGVSELITTARFHQPSGRTNQAVGIFPDFAIDPIPNATEKDKFALREADQFKNAFSKLGEPWVQPHKEYVSKIENCAKSGKYKEKFSDVKSNPKKLPDYRLLVSQDIMECMLANPM